MRIKNDPLQFDSTDLSGDVTSEAIYLGHICNYAIQLVFTGAPEGSFKLQASNDQGHPAAVSQEEREEGVVNWTDIEDSDQAILAAGNHMYQVENAGYLWVRVVWTFDAGTGALTDARFNVKGV